MKRPARHFLTVILALTVLCSATGAAASGRTAVLLYISSETMADLVVPVGQVRQAATESLHANLVAAGHDLLPASDMDQAAGRWRVRGDWALSRPFLDHLGNDLGISLLQIVHLRVERRALSLVSRMVTCPAGVLADIELPTIDTPAGNPDGSGPDADRWLNALVELCASVSLQAPESYSPSSGPTLLVLPAEGIGCEEDRAMSATAFLLQKILGEGRWTLPDPGLAATTLSSQGVAPTRLGRRGRILLTDEFGAQDLLRLTLVTYEQGNGSGGSRLIIEDALALGGSQNFGDFDLSLRRVDLADGTVTYNGSLFAPATSNEGWFGAMNFKSAQMRIEKAVAELWLEFLKPSKEQ
jgi:hypothetical protein